MRWPLIPCPLLLSVFSLSALGQFCGHLGCDAHNRPLPPSSPGTYGKGQGIFSAGVGGSGGGSSSGMSGPKTFLIVVVALALVVFYAIKAVGLRSTWTKQDLRPTLRRDNREGPGVPRFARGVGRSGELRQRRARRSLD